MCFLPCASRQGRPFWPPAGDHEGRPYGAFAPIRKDWEARMAYHILLVDDAPELRRMVGELLEGAGYAVTLAADCAQARRAWTESQPDAALLDVMLPDGDGFSLLEELRRVENCVPVRFLSARDEDEARLRGLGLGADDYITKPFLPQELLLRLAAVLRRVYGAGAGEVLRLGAAEVHWGTGTVRRPGGGEAALTAKEYALLKKLAANRGNIVTIDALCQALWEGPMVGYENTLMVHIRRLREKLETDPSHPQYLLTVRGLGYRLAQEERP